MAKPRRPSLDFLAYLTVRVLVAVAQILTIEQSYVLARLLARFLFAVDARHRKVGLDNLSSAFGPGLTEEQRLAIVYEVFEHFSMMLVEILQIPRKLHPANWRDRITLVGHEAVLDRLISGGPVILLTGHFGNWEMAGYLFGVFGFPPNSVARTLDNPYLDDFLRKFRERTGQKLIPKTGGLRRDARGPQPRGHPLVSRRPGRRPPRSLRRLLRPPRVHPQGHRPPGHRAQGPRRRRVRPPGRARVPVRGRL